MKNIFIIRIYENDDFSSGYNKRFRKNVYDATQVDRIIYPRGNRLVEIPLQCDLETRLEVLLNHPDIIGFLFDEDGVITKACLPTKVVNFGSSSNKKIFAVVSDSVHTYNPISVGDNILLSNIHHLSNFIKFNKSVQ